MDILSIKQEPGCDPEYDIITLDKIGTVTAEYDHDTSQQKYDSEVNVSIKQTTIKDTSESLDIEGCPTKDDPRKLNIERHSTEDDPRKLNIEGYAWYIPVQKLVAKFEKYGHTIRVVGGAVRDILLDTPPQDIDLCTTATPEQMIQILTDYGVMFRETGIQHGTLTVYYKKCDFEMTSLRQDEVIDGVKVCKYGKSYTEDATRRDLTVNAMSVDINGRLYDYHDGLTHLSDRKLLFVENAELRITEDPLRILRYFRFACLKYFDKNCTVRYHPLFRKNAALLNSITGERIWKEFSRILGSKRCSFILEAMEKCGITDILGLPEMSKLPKYRFKEHLEELDIDSRAGIVLGTILKGKPDELNRLCDNWKVSNRVREYSHKACTFIYLSINDTKQQLYKTFDTRFRDEKLLTVQIMKYDTNHDLSENQLQDLLNFSRPEFPFHKDTFTKVPEYKNKRKDALEALKKLWIESGFTLTEEDLLKKLKKFSLSGELDRRRIKSSIN